LFTRLDYIIWIGIIVLALGGVLYYQQIDVKGQNKIEITVDGEVYDIIPLTRDMEDVSREVQGFIGTTYIEISGSRARVTYSDCPDKICVHSGWINKPGQMIVCLPNRVIVQMTSDMEQDIDLYTN